MKLLNVKLITQIHDRILENEVGLNVPYTLDKIEGVFGRINSRIHYENITDPFEVAALYAETISRGHAFPDANKRTAFVCMITFLSINGIFKETLEIVAESTQESSYQVDILVSLAEGKVTAKQFASVLRAMFVIGGVFYGIYKLIEYLRKD